MYCRGRLTTGFDSCGVTNIGGGAFEQSAITSVQIPGSVKSLGDNAFSNCENLTDATISNGVITIADNAFLYSTISNINLPESVVSIGTYSFAYCPNLTDAFMGRGVTNIEPDAFAASLSLKAITVDPFNPIYKSVDGVLFDHQETVLIEYPGGQGGDYVIPYGVTDIGDFAFQSCSNVTSVIMPSSLTTGWGPFFDTLTTAFWLLPNPVILNFNSSFGLGTNGFGFTVSWATNLSVVVEAATDLVNPVWSPVTTNAFSGGTFYFGDPHWTNYPRRFYRVRSQ